MITTEPQSIVIIEPRCSTDRHVHGSQGKINDPNGSRGINQARIMIPVDPATETSEWICDPSGSREENISWFYDPIRFQIQILAIVSRDPFLDWWTMDWTTYLKL